MNVMKKLFVILIFLIANILQSCIKPEPFEPVGREGLADSEDEVFIINGLAETISVINCKDLTIKNDVMETGMWPNYIMFKGNYGYLVNSGDNNIQVFSEDSLQNLYAIDLGVNSNPWMIVFKPYSDTGYVPNFIAGDVAVVDVFQQKVITRINVGTGPEGCAISGNKLYVANTAWNYEIYGFLQGTISVININTHQLIKTINTDKNPQSIIAFPSLNEIHVICTGINGGQDSNDGKINIIDTGTDEIIKTISIGGSPSGNAVDTLNKTVYLTGIGGIQAYNYETGNVIHGSDNYLITGDDPENDFFSGITIDPVYNHIFICNFSYDKIIVIDRTTKKIVKTIQGSDGAQFAVYHHD